MTADSQLAMQGAVLAALQGDASLTALLANGAGSILDHVPSGTAFPYVVIGEAKATDFGSKTSDGMDLLMTIHSWSQHQGMQEVKQIMAAVVDVLDRADLAVSGHNLILLRFQSSEVALAEDGVTRHGIQRFRALTEAV